MNKNLTMIIIAGFFLAILGGTSFAQTRKAVSAAETNGTFRDYFGGGSKGAFNEIKILSVGKGRLKMKFELIYPKGADDANLGSAEGEAAIDGDTATFTPEGFEQCKITIKFVRLGQIKVDQNGTDAECGFGANVSATGSYKKTNRAKPKF